MKKITAFAAALFLGVACAAVTSFAAEAGEITAPFKVYNNTGKPVVDVFMTKSTAEDWGTDLIEQTSYKRMFDTRYISVKLTFDPAESYDFFIRYKDGSEAEMDGLSMEGGTADGGTIRMFEKEVVFIPSGVEDPYAPKEGYVRQLFDIYNDTGKPIVDVYVSETGTNKWSKDLMEQGGFKRALDGQYFEATFEMAKDKTYDLFIRSEDGSEDVAEKLDLSNMYADGGTIHIRKKEVVWIPEGETDPYARK